MKKVYAGKWTLAVTFILLGGSILWNMYGTPKIPIATFYPVVLVFLGLELILKTLIRREGKVSLEGGTVVLLILIMILVNVFSFSFLGPNSGRFFSQDQSLEEFFEELTQGNVMINIDGWESPNTKYQIEEEFSQAGVESIVLDNAFGDVDVEVWQEEEIKLIIEVESKNTDEDYVEGLQEELLSAEISEEGQLTWTSNNRRYLDSSRIDSLRMNYEVFIPEDLALSFFEIRNEFGDVEANGLSNKLILNNRHGNVDLQEITGDLEVENAFGNLELESLEGDVVILNRHGNVTMDNEDEILEGLQITNEFGNVSVALHRDQQGDFDLHTSFGSIDQNLGLSERENMNEARAQGALGDGEAALSVTNRHGNIRMTLED